MKGNYLFLNKKGACFTLEGHFLLRKRGTFQFSLRKGHFLGVGIVLGASAPLPPPPVPPPLPVVAHYAFVYFQLGI